MKPRVVYLGQPRVVKNFPCGPKHTPHPYIVNKILWLAPANISAVLMAACPACLACYPIQGISINGLKWALFPFLLHSMIEYKGKIRNGLKRK